MVDNPYSTFWTAIRQELKAIPTGFSLGTMSGGRSVKLGSIQLDGGDLMVNAELSGKLRAGDRVLLAPLDADGQRYIIICKVVSS